MAELASIGSAFTVALKKCRFTIFLKMYSLFLFVLVCASQLKREGSCLSVKSICIFSEVSSDLVESVFSLRLRSVFSALCASICVYCGVFFSNLVFFPHHLHISRQRGNLSDAFIPTLLHHGQLQVLPQGLYPYAFASDSQL